jgi:hypothetical protein
MTDYDKTMGERYKFSDGEEEVIAEANEILKEIYERMGRLEQLSRDSGLYFINCNICANHEDNLITNGSTGLRIDVSIDDGWLSSYMDC